MSDVLRQIQKLVDRHEALWDLVHRLDQRFYDFSQGLAALEEYVRQEGDVPLRSCHARVKAGGKSLLVESALKSAARKGVSAVRIELLGDRSASVVIGRGVQFPLTETLWVMLEALCRNDGPREGDFVRFKSWKEIGDAMEKRLRRHFTKHAIHQTLCRLRAVLCGNFDASGGANPFLVQTRKDAGARFLLKRDGELVICGEAP